MSDTQKTPADPATPRDGSAGNAEPPRQNVFALTLAPVNNSDQPVVANTTHIHLAPGMAYIDFGFIEPGVLAALPRAVEQGVNLPKEITGKLAVRVLMGYDGLAALQQQLTRLLTDVAKLATAPATAPLKQPGATT